MIKHFLTKIRSVSVLSLMLLPCLAMAAPRSAADAQKLAEKHLKLNHSDAKLSLAESSTRGESQNYFTFNVSGNNGFVIVSADDNFSEILGYSDSGNFDDARNNPSFEFWLSRISDEMASFTPRKASTRSDGNPAIRKYVIESDVAPLLKSKWNQGEPYNNDCWVPRTNDHAPTGCVATAMAQVLYYHQWPQYYVNGDEKFEYKWDLMLPEYRYDTDASEESKDQVAKLMKHCGVSVNMKYGYNASSAYSTDVPTALVNNFSYDGSKMKFLNRDSYGYDAIHRILYTEFKEGRPVIASGSYPQSDLGHEFVLDGCTTDGLIHVNWGWSGYCDGYYRLTSMRPEDFGTGGSEEGYSFYMDLVTGIQPNKNLDPTVLVGQLTGEGDLKLAYTTEETVEYGYYDNASSQGYYLITVTTENGFVNGFRNTGAGNVDNAHFATRIVNQATGEEIICCDTQGAYPSIDGLPSGYYYSAAPLTYTDPSKGFDLEDGVPYKAYLGYVTDADGSFNEVLFSPSCRSYLILERNGDFLKVTQPALSNNLSGEFPAGLDRIARKDAVKFTTTFRNDSDVEYLGQVKWRFLDENNETYPYDYATDFLMLDLLPGESITEEFYLYKLKSLYPGIYRIGLFDFRDRLISEVREIELYDYSLAIDETNFPDPEFRAFIADNYDLDRDGSLDDSELSENYMRIENLTIDNIKGIENFQGLWYIILNNCTISELEISGFPELYQIWINNLPLETISVTDVPDLTYFTCANTQLKEIDLSPFTNLNSVEVNYNPQLESLKLPANAPITNLEFSECNISSIDLSGFPKLGYLNGDRNSLSELDLTNCPDLEFVRVSENNLEKIDINGLRKLKSFSVQNNRITGSLDLSQCEDLVALIISGNNYSELILGNNPQLEYIYAWENQIGGTVDLSGCEQLTDVTIPDNKIKEIIFGNHPRLENVDISRCEIEGTVDISGMPALRNFFANFNRISEIKYSEHPELYFIQVIGNALTHFHAEEIVPYGYFYSNDQVIPMTVSTADLDLSPLMEKGFDPARATNWIAFWNDGQSNRGCEVNNNVVEIPEEAGDEVQLVYQYLVNPAEDYRNNFTIKLTRNGSGSVNGILADGSYSVEGGRIIFGEGISGEIYTAAGVRIFSGYGESDALPSGVYIVRIGSGSAKIAVK